MSSLLVGAYRGRSWLSRIIQWQTRSAYSHVALIRTTGEVLEAWHNGGVILRTSIDDGHTTGTVINLYAADVPQEALERVWDFAAWQIGKGYDWRGVVGFLTRTDGQSHKRWFCSELVAAAFESAGYPLLNTEPHKISPGMVTMSPRLRYVAAVVTK